MKLVKAEQESLVKVTVPHIKEIVREDEHLQETPRELTDSLEEGSTAEEAPSDTPLLYS